MLREDQALLQRSPRCADTVVAILTACGAGVEGSSAAGRGRVPSAQPALVQQIVDMGFPRNRVEEALRRVRCICCCASSTFCGCCVIFVCFVHWRVCGCWSLYYTPLHPILYYMVPLLHTFTPHSILYPQPSSLPPPSSSP